MVVRERGIEASEIEREMIEQGVMAAINIVSSREEFEQSRALDLSNVSLFHIAGIHPHEADGFDGDTSWIRNIADDILAVGESGLDFFYDLSDRKRQEKVFEQMVELAEDLRKPLVVHGRDAEARVLDILSDHGFEGSRTLFHCYTGTVEDARRILDSGASISLSGILTFKGKKCDYLREILSFIPKDRLMLETDSPFLAPVPYRGKVNTPGKVAHIYRFAAETLSIHLAELEKNINDNINRFFDIQI